MRINAVGNTYYRNNLNFNGENKKGSHGLKNGAKAVALATALSAAGGGMQSCDKFKTDVHNHFIEWPASTPDSSDLRPVVTPPQTIIVEKIIHKTDTINHTDTIHHTDTLRDTVFVKPDTTYIKEEWKSKVPPKQEEIYDNWGITPEGNGKFFIKEYFYDRKNITLTQRLLDGQASSRNGDVLVYNVIKTKWDDESEGIVPGKNETYEKHLVYLSDDNRLLGIKCFVPKNNVKFENDEGKNNWHAFKNPALSTPDKWQDSYSTFMENEGKYVSTDDGFKLMGKEGEKNTVTVFNPYNSEWDLTNYTVVKGDPD